MGFGEALKGNERIVSVTSRRPLRWADAAEVLRGLFYKVLQGPLALRGKVFQPGSQELPPRFWMLVQKPSMASCTRGEMEHRFASLSHRNDTRYKLG